MCLFCLLLLFFLGGPSQLIILLSNKVCAVNSGYWVLLQHNNSLPEEKNVAVWGSLAAALLNHNVYDLSACSTEQNELQCKTIAQKLFS